MTIDSKEGQAKTGMHGVLACATTVVALLMLFPCFFATSASAAPAPEELLFVDLPSDSPDDLQVPSAIATDPQSGHFFVADGFHGRILEYTSWGTFVKSIGWGVRNGAAELQTCGPGAVPPSTTCQAGSPGDGAGQIGDDTDIRGFGIALDPAGDIYIWEREYHRVQKFSQSGEFLLMFGGEVNETDGTNVCTQADLEAGDDCGAGIVGTGPGEFSTNAVGDFVAVNSTGTVYVADVGRVQEFSTAGAYLGELTIPSAPGLHLEEFIDLDGSGNLYISEPLERIGGAWGRPDIRKYSPSGELLATLPVDGPGAIALDSKGNVYVARVRPGQSAAREVLKLDPSGTCLVCPGDNFPAGLPGSGWIYSLATNLLGDGTSAPGDLYIGVDSRVGIFGPIPRFELPPEVPPTIEDQFTLKASQTGASFKATINPHFFPETTYYLEYGTEECSIGGCAATPVESLPGERNAGIETRAIDLSGLSPGTTYNYRFVAVSGSLTAKGVGESEAEGTFTTRRAGSAGLPDARAYELVSPVDKQSGDVGVPSAIGGLVNNSVKPQQAAPSGNAITYASFTAFGEDVQSAPGGSQYLSRRTAAGWATDNITPPYEGSFTRDPLRGFSPSLDWAAIIQREPVLVPGAPQGVENLYLKDPGGNLTLVSDVQPQLKPGTPYCINFTGASEDFSRIIIAATGALTPEASAGESTLYEWSAAEGFKLVSVLPNGNPAPLSPFSGFGSGSEACVIKNKILHNAISADGSKIFWTQGSSERLFARVDGALTVQLDAKQGGTGTAGGGQYWDASDDGSRVVFSDASKLTPGAGDGSLYLYDFDLPEGSRLTNISVGPGNPKVKGVLGTSEDLSRVYFAGEGALTGEEENSQGVKAETGKYNLYLWEEGAGLTFIAQLKKSPEFDESDQADWSPTPGARPANATADGLHLAFLSLAPLTGFDNRSQSTGLPAAQAYVYSAETGELRCASCNPTGARPLGDASLPGWSTPYQAPRYLSEDGSRLFFTTVDALAGQDNNGKADIYQFELAGTGTCTESGPTYSVDSGGCIDLISSGRASVDSYLIDASPDGADVFFSTPAKLLARDQDERYDIYDARVGGGFPEPLPPPSPCQGESCRPIQPPPAAAVPGSSGFQGEGNVPPPKGKKCPKGKKKVKKNGKVRCVPVEQRSGKKSTQQRRGQGR